MRYLLKWTNLLSLPITVYQTEQTHNMTEAQKMLQDQIGKIKEFLPRQLLQGQ